MIFLDSKLTDHTLLEAIARINQTNKNKFRGYIMDYFGLSYYLTEALEMISNEKVRGALTDQYLLRESLSVMRVSPKLIV